VLIQTHPDLERLPCAKNKNPAIKLNDVARGGNG
jgi:hypothetical protein